MTYREAVEVLYKYGCTYLAHMKKESEDGPEGIDVYINPQIAELSEALRAIKEEPSWSIY